MSCQRDRSPRRVALLGLTAGSLLLAPAAAQSTLRASVGCGGAQGSSFNTNPSVSADGRFVAFSSVASKLVAGDTNAAIDIFVSVVGAVGA
jgi:hypothetical protein